MGPRSFRSFDLQFQRSELEGQRMTGVGLWYQENPIAYRTRAFSAIRRYLYRDLSIYHRYRASRGDAESRGLQYLQPCGIRYISPTHPTIPR